MAWVSIMTSLSTAMQFRSPDDVLGRCLSTYQAITFGGMAIGAWFWGAVADAVSLPVALHAASGFMALGTVVLWRLAPMPKAGEGVVEAR
jgi:predicted MFS family arabinose efflux permease